MLGELVPGVRGEAVALADGGLVVVPSLTVVVEALLRLVLQRAEVSEGVVDEASPLVSSFQLRS